MPVNRKTQQNMSGTSIVPKWSKYDSNVSPLPIMNTLLSDQTCLLPNASHDYLEVYWTHYLEVCRVAGAWRGGGACKKFLVIGSNSIPAMHLLPANRQATHLKCVRALTVAAIATAFSVDAKVLTNLHRRRYILLTKASVTNITEYEWTEWRHISVHVLTDPCGI
jgi:hypothetical protein